MTDGRAVRDELGGSLQFIMGVLVFGAAIFSVLFNLIYLAVENDLELQRAYLVIAHADEMPPEALDRALSALESLVQGDVRQGERPILCEEDEALIALQAKIQGVPKKRVTELLIRKTGVESGWRELYIRELPTSRSPFRMPFLELNMMYYGWVIEIGTLIFLSQSLRKPQVLKWLFQQILKPYYFIPVTTALLYVPAWHWATLLYPRTAGWPASILAIFGCLLLASVMFRVAQLHLNEQKLNELGFHLLISSLFIHLLTTMGDPDVVYQVFTQERMTPLRYLSWFIIACYPALLAEKWYRGTRAKGLGQE